MASEPALLIAALLLVTAWSAVAIDDAVSCVRADAFEIEVITVKKVVLDAAEEDGDTPEVSGFVWAS